MTSRWGEVLESGHKHPLASVVCAAMFYTACWSPVAVIGRRTFFAHGMLCGAPAFRHALAPTDSLGSLKADWDWHSDQAQAAFLADLIYSYLTHKEPHPWKAPHPHSRLLLKPKMISRTKL